MVQASSSEEMAAASRYSGDNIGRGGRRWASVVAGNASITPPASPAPVVIDREGCLGLVLPPESRITITDIAIALGQQGGDGGQWQPFVDKGHIILQALTSGPGIEAQKMRFVAEGLPVKSIIAKCTPLVNSAHNDNLVEGKVEGLCASQEGQRLMKEHLERLGRLLVFNIETYPGSNGVPTGSATFLLDISEHRKAPKPHYILDFGTWTNHVHVSIVGKQKFCYYCREKSHLRKDCPNAPECNNCGSRGHSYNRCREPPVIDDQLDYGEPYSPASTHRSDDSDSSASTPPSSADSSLRDPVAGVVRETPEQEDRDHPLSSQESAREAGKAASTAISMQRSRSWAGEMDEDEEETQSAGNASMLSTQDVGLTQDAEFQTVVNRRTTRAMNKQKANQVLTELAKANHKRARHL